MTPQQLWDFTQLCRRIVPRTPDEAQLIYAGIRYLNLQAAEQLNDKGQTDK